jgi:UDPglucose--hexose-1-phosphate uridylyltransferase
LVETPNHDADYHEIPVSEIYMIMKVLKNHYSDLMEIEDINYVTIFKNHGDRGGESIHHPHMQVIASPLFPQVIEDEMESAEHYFKKEKECGSCKVIFNELKRGKRIIHENRNWVCFTPFVSTWPYQMSFYPKRHVCDISEMTDQELKDYASILHKVFLGIYKLFDDFPYNMIYHNFPKSDFWHFHVELIPRLVTHAGFEFFGLNVNIVSPEVAAKDLRRAIK